MDVDQDRAEVRHVRWLDQHVLLAAAAEDAADVEPRERRQVGSRRVAELHALERLDDGRHLLYRVHGALETSDVSRHAVGVNCHVHDARVYGDEIVGTERLGDYRGVGAQPALHQIVRALAALGLAGDAGDDQVAGKPDAGAANGLRGHDDAGQAALHVLHAVTVEAIALEARRPRIALPAAGERVDVGVAVEHQAGAAARTAKDGDGLEAAGLDLLQIDGVVAAAEELLEEQRDLGLFGLEARDADERAGQVDQLARVDEREHRARPVIHWRGR